MTLSFNFWEQAPATTPPVTGTYVTEDGAQRYVTEDGSLAYVPES